MNDFSMFFKAFHIGIGMAVLDGRMNETKAAGRFLVEPAERTIKNRAFEPAAVFHSRKIPGDDETEEVPPEFV